LLVSYEYKGKTFEFSERNSRTENNIYTIIVGKNGTGKSRLLKSIIQHIIKRREDGEEYVGFFSEWNQQLSALKTNYNPENVIAVSTSPFDKFPLRHKHQESDFYSYLGLRNLRSTDLGMAYMARIFGSLTQSILSDHYRLEKISTVLEYLGYNPILSARYHLELPPRIIIETLESKNPIESFISLLTDRSRNIILNRVFRNFFDDNDEPNVEKVSRVLEIYERISSRTSKPRIEVYLEERGVFLSYETITIEDLLYLEELGVARLRDITLTKANGNTFRIGDASSGEQSVVMSILGIASQISNGSLICIDEPEVCLHPEWQERYIDLLISTFRDYFGCHFIIATHSPLMVSKLKNENCYLMAMEDGYLVNASKINKKSVDFQLANTFKTPGFKNEYLSRELISILSQFGAEGRIESSTLNKLKDILKLKNQIDDSDPVKRLMSMAEEALKEIS